MKYEIIDKKIIRAVLYIRVSSEEQVRHGYSLDLQKKRLIEFCKSKNYKKVSFRYPSYRCNYKYQQRCSYNKRPVETTVEKYLLANIENEIEKYKIEINEIKEKIPKIDINKLKKKLAIYAKLFPLFK